MAFDMKDYVTVPERVAEFYRQHPEGRICSSAPEVVTIGNATFIAVTTEVYRTPDDPRPCVGSAWEPFPGRTPYTKEAEMMNAETSAIGRALAAAGIMVHRSLASANEVAARQDAPAAKSGKGASRPPKASTSPATALAAPTVVDAIKERLGALRDEIRPMAKRAFLEEFGSPDELAAGRVAEALELVAEWEMA